MSSAKPIGRHAGVAPGKAAPAAPAVSPAQAAPDPLAQARTRRMAALMAAEGLWKGRADLPQDGVQAQEQLRSEWHES